MPNACVIITNGFDNSMWNLFGYGVLETDSVKFCDKWYGIRLF